MTTVLIQAARTARDQKDLSMIEQVLRDEDKLRQELELEISYLEAQGQTPEKSPELKELFQDHGSLIDELKAAAGRPELSSLESQAAPAEARQPEPALSVHE